jgi:guanine deaminase
MPDRNKYLKMAIDEALRGLRSHAGGPFGAVIVKGGTVLGTGYNTVISSRDPTAHAEINAIRDACKHLRQHHLTGAVLYSNFEPCPMCLSAIYWADIREVYYCAGREVAGKIGFMDDQLYREFTLPAEHRKVVATRIEMPGMDRLLEEWSGMEGKVLY